MSIPPLADLDAATAATEAAIADPSADLAEVYLAAEAEEAAFGRIFTGPCDPQPAPLAPYLEAAEPEPEIELGDRTMSNPSPADVFAAFFSAADPEPEPDPEAELGHEYDGPESHVGTSEYQAERAEYEAWVGHAGPENRPVPYTLTAQAEAALDAAEPEPEAEPW